MPEQYTATDRLALVMDAIQIGRKTGILLVRRGDGAWQEEGSIIFVSGQIVRAITGARIGADALQILTSWTPCQFLFQPSIPSDVVLPGAQTLPPPVQISPRVERQMSPLPERAEDRNNVSPLSIIPQRARNSHEALFEIERRGLSRLHRHAFLLIDGRRSIKDLVILIGRSPDELVTLLHQLERAGLIRL